MTQHREYTFDEAAQAAGTGRFHIILVLVTGFALLNVVSEGLGELHISTGEQGLINAVAFIGVVMTSHFWGFMSDTWGRKKVLQAALGGGFVFSAASSVSVNSAMLLVTRLCVGLCISGVMSAAISYLGEFHSDRTRTRYVTIASMFMTIAAVYQALMGLFILPRTWEFSLFGWMLIRSWRIFLLTSSSMTGLTFVAFFFLPESPKFMLAMGRPDEAVRILRQVHAVNGLRSRETYPVRRIRNETVGSRLADVDGVSGMVRMVWKQTRPLLRKEHVGNVVTFCALTFGTFMLGHGFYMWFPQSMSLYLPLMDESVTFCEMLVLGLANASRTAVAMRAVNESVLVVAGEELACRVDNEPRTYYIILAMGLAMIAAYTLTAIFSDRLGMKNILTAWLVFNATLSIALIFTRNFYVNVALSTWIMSTGSVGGILSSLAADFFPTHIKGVALCFVMMFGRLGAVFGSNLIGMLLNAHQCNGIFGAFTGILMVSACLTYYILWRKDHVTASTKL